MTRPNFLIVGAPKSGTTSLYRYLQAHPDVFLPEVKEPALFSPNEGRKVETLSEYEELFREARASAVGEASVTYLYDPDAAALIREALGPRTRIVILLRNPIDMAHSLWGYHVELGWENLGFAEALAAEPARLEGSIPLPRGGQARTHYAYTCRARYSPQVRRYLETFGPEQVFVRIFEEFFAEPHRSWVEICSFLGLDPGHVPEFKVHNRSGKVRFRGLAALVNRRAGWKWPLKAILPLEIRVWMLDRVNRWNTGKRRLLPVTAEDRLALRLLFDDDVRALERLLGRDLSSVWW